jgi:DNA-binding PadR family transcriptional regulator
MSGYDIKRTLKSLTWLIGSPSSGSLYPILRTLLHEELATVEIVPGVDRPPRKIYSITDAGRQALQEWLDQSVVANTPLKGFVMRLLLADRFSTASLAAHLQQRRDQVAGQRASLQEMAVGLEGGTGLGQNLALGYGLALAGAELTWLDGALGELSRQAMSDKEAGRGSTASTA